MLTVNVRQSILLEFNRLNKPKPPVTVDDVNFAAPEVWIQGECNSRVRVVAKATSNAYGGQQTVYYTRRRLSDELKGIKIPGKSTDYKRLYEVLAVLRDKMGLPLLDSEFVDRGISGATVTIETTIASLGYLPSDSITLDYVEK